MTVRASERELNKGLFKLRQRLVEQWLVTFVQLSLGPGGENPRPFFCSMRRSLGSAQFSRNIFGRDYVAGRRYSKSARSVNQLAHVAGPTEGLKGFERVRIDAFRRRAEFLASLGKVMLEQKRYVFAALAQWWCVDADNVEEMIEFYPEPGFLQRPREVLVGGGYYPYIYSYRGLPADAVKLALRKLALLPRLQRWRDVADFVEIQGAAVGLFEAPHASRVGACKCAFFMSEKL